MAWTVEIGNQGAALDEYPAVDFDFIKRLNAVGWGHANLAGLDGNSEPVADDVIRFIYDKGGTEFLHFEGILLHSERLGTDPIRKVTFMDVAGAQLWRAKTGTARHFQDQTPHSIIQGSTSPYNLLVNAQEADAGTGGKVITYGTSASVPNKVNASRPGVILDDFMADSTRLLVNVQRLCLQARYDDGTGTDTPDGSYGLEFFGQLEGANNSNPRFYLVKRMLQSPAPGETYGVGDEIFKARRGEKGLTAADAVRVVGGGHGQSRIQSAVIGSGGLEGIVQDKSIIATTNATNMANRLQGLLDSTIEAITAWSYKHDYDTRLGDDLTITQTGLSNKTLRAYEIGYSLRAKHWIWQLGRPRPMDKDPFYALESIQGSHGTVGQRRGFSQAGFNTGSNAALIQDASLTVNVTLNPDYLKQLHDALTTMVVFTSDAPGGEFDLRITLNDGASGLVLVDDRILGNASGDHLKPYYFDAAIIENVSPFLTQVTDVDVRITNRNVPDAAVTLSSWVNLSGA